MLLIEVKINDEDKGMLGGGRLKHISAGIIRVAPNLPFSLVVSGSQDTPFESISWPSYSLTKGDKISILCRQVELHSDLNKPALKSTPTSTTSANLTQKPTKILIDGPLNATWTTNSEGQIQISIEFNINSDSPRLQIGGLQPSKEEISEQWLDISIPTGIPTEFTIT